MSMFSNTSFFSSVTCEVMCHIRFSLRNFNPYGPISSARACSSRTSEYSSALKL
uniref:Uncharacterized protein n=1 Tax=Anguilla anguilla TaxID=7936 RepID=A0A0E9QDR4_ANGAN